MNFQPTDDQRMLGDSLNRFIAEQYGFAARDRIARSAHGFSPDIWRQFAELGVIGALFSEADGGFGGSGFDIAVVFEALGRGLVVEPLLGALMAGEAIRAAGSAAQRALLGRLIDGSRVAAFAHDEPDGHWEHHRVQTRAEPHRDGWRLNGAKTAVPQGERADLFVVSARTAGAVDGAAGIALFVVPAGTPGLTVRGCQAIDGGRVAELAFDDVVLPADALLAGDREGDGGSDGGSDGGGDGGGDGGTAALERVIGRGVLALCAEALGAMEAVKAATLDHLRTRQQFGQPIGSFQALQHRMADLLIEIEQARSAVINAAAAVDGSDRLARERALSAAKFSIGRIGTRVAEEGIQLHGGIGMTWELPMPHYAKRLVMIDHQLGDEDHHLQRFIALGREQAATARGD